MNVCKYACYLFADVFARFFISGSQISIWSNWSFFAEPRLLQRWDQAFGGTIFKKRIMASRKKIKWYSKYEHSLISCTIYVVNCYLLPSARVIAVFLFWFCTMLFWFGKNDAKPVSYVVLQFGICSYWFASNVSVPLGNVSWQGHIDLSI